MYFTTKQRAAAGAKLKGKRKRSKAAKKEKACNLSLRIKTTNEEEPGVEFELELDGSPSAPEVRAAIEDDVLAPWLPPEYLNQGFRVYYKNQEGSFLMSNQTQLKILAAAENIVVIVNTDKRLPEEPEEPEAPEAPTQSPPKPKQRSDKGCTDEENGLCAPSVDHE